MKADYKNRMPKGMVTGTGCGMILVLFLILGVSPIVPEGADLCDFRYSRR